MEQETTLNYLDVYCERGMDPGFWAEPLNAVTNLLFILAAYLAWRHLSQHKARDFRSAWDAWLLILSLFSIGVGSGLWHLYHNQATVLMDVIPITLFINIYLIAAMRRFVGLSWAKTGVLWVVYASITVWTQVAVPPDTFFGSIMYVPTYIALVIITAVLWRQNVTDGRAFARLLAIWTVSLTVRTFDLTWCAHFPMGTHFLWHSLNAYVLYHFLRLLMGKLKA